ncbi:MAG TPA: hypothetical protein VGV07_24980 [Devosia sp.]|jgi:hypothetical protein|uniref:hypothetical protein n=1 Tax=Devosia sp. TaxID=1871048 RepID=UPI002DDD4134|nr:hypothetical protein [Devosia sp.]HEV2518526.1 hypothetical protein [Devosia sp.]
MDPGQAAAVGARTAALQFITLGSMAILALSLVVTLGWILFGAPHKHIVRLSVLLFVLLGSAGLLVLSLAG